MKIPLRILRSPAVFKPSPKFRPHIHSKNCVLCAASKADGYSSASVKTESPRTTSSIARNTKNLQSNSSPSTPEMRKVALEQWTQGPGKDWILQQTSAKSTNVDLANSWNAFCDPNRILSDTEVNNVVDYLYTFCDIKTDEQGKPRSAVSSENISKSAHGVKYHPSDRFIGHLRNCLKSPDDIEKQLRFQRALLDFREVAEAVKLSFFLSCGTALGAYREGHFILHDNDIDLGVFYEDLCNIGESDENCEDSNGSAQAGVIALLSQIAVDGRFVLFDVCGLVEKGLELRFLHEATQIPVDLNVYYPHLPEDVDLVSRVGPFVWTASHYEDSASRRHGMYRYRHTPFRSDMVRLPFCDTSSETRQSEPFCEGFLLPPKVYLEEYFGEDWRMPKKYSYFEGLQKEYKNIIEE